MIVQETEKERITRLIFQEISFPFLSVDLAKLSNGIANPLEKSSFISFPISDKPKADVIRGLLRGLIRNIEPSIDLINYLGTSKFIQSTLKESNDLKSKIEEPNNNYFIFTKENNLVWEEKSYWPLAYSTIFSQLLSIIEFYTLLLDRRKKEMEEVIKGQMQMSIASDFPRNMPTQIHYAFASFGAWIGGAGSIPYLSLYATKYQIKRSEKNIEYLRKIGYSETESKILDESGIIGIPASLALPLMNLQDNKIIFGSIPLEEFSLANYPPKGTMINKVQQHLDESKLSGFTIDKYYRTPFLARRLKKKCLLGGQDILRDHYTEFYNSIEHSGLIRCKHYNAPIIEISSLDEMKKIITQIPERGEGGLFFRGQTSFYEIKRHKKVKELLFGDSVSIEPSLISSANRSNFEYDNLHFALKHFLGQDYLFDKKNKDKLLEKWEEKSKSPLCHYDLAIMALAQHYGFPTNGLDVTLSLDVATWFATNKFNFDKSSGRSSYSKLTKDQWNADKSKWPVVFVFQTILNSNYGSLQDCQELNDLELEAMRPTRQSAKFFLGGHSDHQNRLAESVVCMFQLKPNDYITNLSFDYLFPSPSEDPVYKLLLDLSKNKHFQKIIKKEINYYH